MLHQQMALAVHQHAMPTLICLFNKKKISIPKCWVDVKEIKILRPKNAVVRNTHRSICNILFLFLTLHIPSKDLRIVPISRIILSKSNQRHHSTDLNAAYNFFVLYFFGCQNLNGPSSLIYTLLIYTLLHAHKSRESDVMQSGCGKVCDRNHM